ncbi:MAG TPA: AAA family ATPase [Solirubrobacteraceae bacterium]|jgi:exodeoxyribonuclease V alpha subunit|nr:AAA family ATPase [Solirubrobacteraceae bacterium]
MDYNAQVTVRRTRFANDATGWAVVEAVEDSGDEVVLVGPLHHLEDRERAHVVGTWQDDSRFGLQVKVTQADPLPPSDEQALLAYLVRVRHIGPRRAARLIERYGESGVLEAIDRDPSGAFLRAGLSPRRAREAAHSWDGLRVTRRLHLLLAPHGLAYLVAGIQREFGDAAHRVVRDRPYELTSVFGVGFSVADRIAAAAGISAESPERARAGILHVLAEGERSGSTCLPIEGLRATCAELLGRESPREEFIDELVERGDLERAGDWIYRAVTARLEAELAELIRAMLESRPAGRLREPPPEPEGAPVPASDPERAPELATPTLSEEQWAGVRAAFTERLSLITGGPGTGKTASIRTIGMLAVTRGAKVMLVAPTGRAAMRMTEATSMRASTVHSALGWIPGEGPTHDEDDTLACDLLIVDETSMANLELLLTLLRAVGHDTNVVLVGDADQLAPVGAGKPFAELVASGLVPTARLTHIFRQAAGSMIVQGAHAIRRGEAPDFAAGPGMRRDLFLIERSDPAAARREIVDLVSERLPAHYGIDPITDIQVFAPVYRGELGIDRLNEALRDALNPDGTPVRGGRLRLGDKLMLTGRNLHDLGLMNGTLLRLIDEVTAADAGDDEEAALILAAEEAIFRLPPEDAERLKLAYACSVHRGQGVELPVAVIVAHQAGGAFFLRREMLYTAITRAKLATVIVGTGDVLARAARTPDTGRRHGRLTERLREAS